MRPTFPEWALGLAKAASMRSEDPYVQVGSVVVAYDWTVLGIGYNGLPPKVDMPASWWDDRDGRRPFMIHAEQNALRTVSTTHASGLMVISTHIPCSTCMSLLGSYRVGVVYYEKTLGAAHDHELILKVAELHGIHIERLGWVPGFRPETPCEEWMGAYFGNGYPAKHAPELKKTVAVHRWVVAQDLGWDAIAGQVVMHLCDNKRCVRRDHLMVGDDSMNALDRWTKHKLDQHKTT